MLRQSPRFGVSSRLNRRSSSARCFSSGVPGRTSPSNSSKPSDFSARPSSEAEHSMPLDSTPRSSALPISTPPGSRAPGSAAGTRMPAHALAAPQTILKGVPVPASTSHTCRRSACGCGSVLRMRPTTTPRGSSALSGSISHSSPARLSFSAKAAASTAGLTHSRNQFSEIFMGRCADETCDIGAGLSGTVRGNADRCRRTGADRRRRSATSPAAPRPCRRHSRCSAPDRCRPR